MVSQNAMLVVLNYSPTEGEAGVPIAVDIDLCTTMQSGDGKMPPMKLRLVIGRTALPTIVRDLSPPANIEGNNDGPEQPHGRSVFRLRVTANAPDYFGARFPEQQSVPLTLQAIGPVSPNDVIDQVIFGSFTYWGPSTSICPDLILPTDGAVAAVVKGSPTQMSGVKRPREQDDYREASRPIPPPPVPTTANPTALSLTRPEVELSLMRTTSVPRNQTGVVEAKLEWVVTDDCPHPKDMEQQNTWLVRIYSTFQPFFIILVPGHRENIVPVDDSCVFVVGKSAVFFKSHAKRSPKKTLTRPISSSRVFIGRKTVVATSPLWTSFTCWSVLSARRSLLRRKTAYVGTWKGSNLSPLPSTVLDAIGSSRGSWTSPHQSRGISRKT